MHYRNLGNTGLQVSEIGFGGGAIGGLLVKGERPEMLRVVERAIELGVTYFDTAEAYGGGVSETNLGWVLSQIKADTVIGTKVILRPGRTVSIKESVLASMEGSLKRLGMESVDLIQLHNHLMPSVPESGDGLTLSQLDEVREAFEIILEQGKARHWGINAMGDPATVNKATVESGAETIQCMYNMLNPGAGWPLPEGYPYIDYDRVIDAAAEAGVGVMAVRVLAGGALTGTTFRHKVGAAEVNPIGTATNLATDARNALRFSYLIEEGYVESLVEAAIRFDLSHPGVSVAMVGISEMSHLEQAVAFANRGPLPQEALDRLPEIWATLEDE